MIMELYVLKKIGQYSYVGDLKYKLFYKDNLIAVIITKETDIDKIIASLINNNVIEDSAIIKIGG